MSRSLTSRSLLLVAASALAMLPGCDRSKASLEREAHHEEEAQRAAGRNMQAPAPSWAAVRTPSVLTASPLRTQQGHVHNFHLNLPQDWKAPKGDTVGFDKATIERFVVRLPSGNQENIGDLATRSGDELVYSYPETGTMQSSMCVYGPKTRAGKAPLYCLKRIYTVGEHRSEDAMPSSTARLGDFAELRPMVAPEQLLPGSDFPVMAYLGGDRAKNVVVHAFAPDGKIIAVQTGHAGVADIPIHKFGDWKVRVAGEVDGVPMVAELEFSNAQGGR